MQPHPVVHFKPYPLHVGQKLTIESGPRKGDWEVIGVTKDTVKLRCPVTQREVEWRRFCYFVEEKERVEWPGQEDDSSLSIRVQE